MRLNGTTRASALALTLLLGACGGGGGGDGGVNSTPTPEPSPTPTPTTGANDDLLPTLVSESFANVATRGALSGTESNVTGTASKITATISYNAANQSYTLTTPTGSVTFGPGNIDAAQSNAGAVVYVRTNGSTTDSLTLTRPGSSGRLTYRYVGSAFWQRMNVGPSSGSGSLDAIVYGVPTPASAIPTSGSANYEIDLLGAATIGPNVFPISGAGTAMVDFVGGNVIISGTMNRVVAPGQTTAFNSTARLAAGSNAFSGNFTFDDFGTLNGTLDGRFYGPAAEEIGAAFQASGQTNRVAAGTIMGRRSASAPANTSFNGGLVNSQSFLATEAKLTLESPSGVSNNNGVNTMTNRVAAVDGLTIYYNAANGGYTLVAPDRSTTFVGGQPVPMLPSGSEALLVQAQPGYSYVARGDWTYGGGSPTIYRLANFILGMPTGDGQLVRSGKGYFSVDITGRAADSDYKNMMNFVGRGTMTADFAANQLSLIGGLTFIEDWNLSGRAREGATGTLSGTGAIASSANSFSGSLGFNGIGNYTGNFSGQFYGPGADELGAVFTAADGSDRAVGTLIGKRDAALAAGQKSLNELSGPTVLKGARASKISGPWPGPVSGLDMGGAEVDYDPTTKTYNFYNLDTSGVRVGSPVQLAQSNVVSAQSDASRTSYLRIEGGVTTAGYIFNSGAANPELALSYTSFANLTVTTASNVTRLFPVFGIVTPLAGRPIAGTANYSGIAVGYGTANAIGYQGSVSGTSTLMANFARNEVTFSVVLAADDPGRTSIGTFSYAGSIANNGFFSPALAFQGDFLGPNAQEFGAAFQIGGNSSDPTTIAGVAVGKRVP